MGLCCCKKYIQPPSAVSRVSARDVTTILSKSIGIKPCDVNTLCRNYFTYDVSKLKDFLISDVTRKQHTATTSTTINRDTIRAFVDEEKSWTQKTDIRSTLGVCYGDIRCDVEDNQPRLRVANIFIDNSGIVWIIEPATYRIFRPTSESVFIYITV
jgi:hypothetical protein